MSNQPTTKEEAVAWLDARPRLKLLFDNLDAAGVLAKLDWADGQSFAAEANGTELISIAKLAGYKTGLDD